MLVCVLLGCGVDHLWMHHSRGLLLENPEVRRSTQPLRYLYLLVYMYINTYRGLTHTHTHIYISNLQISNSISAVHSVDSLASSHLPLASPPHGQWKKKAISFQQRSFGWWL